MERDAAIRDLYDVVVAEPLPKSMQSCQKCLALCFSIHLRPIRSLRWHLDVRHRSGCTDIL